MRNRSRKNWAEVKVGVIAVVLCFSGSCIAFSSGGGVQAEAKQLSGELYTSQAQEPHPAEKTEVAMTERQDDEVVIEHQREITAEEPEIKVAKPDLPYTEDDVIALAQMAYGEAFITGSDTEISACMWCACNRLDSGDSYYNSCDSVYDIVTQKCQFYGYRENNSVNEHLVWLAQDVLDRWAAERNGATDVGRTLPKDYCFFWGDGLHNHFTTENMGGIKYDWSLPSPYES